MNAYQALRERAAWIDLEGRGKIRVTGDDRARLLHAMCTNHVEQLQPGTGCYAFFLTAQGRIIADVNIFCLPDHLLLDTEPDTRQRLMEHLDKFIIADDVTLHDFTDDFTTIGLEGPKAEEILNELGAMPAHIPCSIVEWGHSQVAHCSYTGSQGYMIFAAKEDRDRLVAQLTEAGVPQADLDTANIVRIEKGQPRYGVDFSEAQIPHETRRMGAVHFSKGCYLGQEIVERVRSRGHVNRELTGLEIEGDTAPDRGAAVQAGGKDVGEITSAAFSPGENRVLAFAMVRTEALQPSVELSVAGNRAMPKALPEQPAGC